MGLFDKIKQGLQKTSDAVNRSLDNVFAAFVKIDADLLEELEEALILSDVGAETSAKIVAEVEKRAKLRKITTAPELRDLLREVLTDNMLDNQPLDVSGKPAVILVIGVNGVGKTTSAAPVSFRHASHCNAPFFQPVDHTGHGLLGQMQPAAQLRLGQRAVLFMQQRQDIEHIEGNSPARRPFFINRVYTQPAFVISVEQFILCMRHAPPSFFPYILYSCSGAVKPSGSLFHT